jgi:hypothetical protein
MPKIPGIGQKEAVHVFETLGFRTALNSRPIIMINARTRPVIPRHDTINSMTTGGISKAAGLTPEQFRELH